MTSSLPTTSKVLYLTEGKAYPDYLIKEYTVTERIERVVGNFKDKGVSSMAMSLNGTFIFYHGLGEGGRNTIGVLKRDLEAGVFRSEGNLDIREGLYVIKIVYDDWGNKLYVNYQDFVRYQEGDSAKKEAQESIKKWMEEGPESGFIEALRADGRFDDVIKRWEEGPEGEYRYCIGELQVHGESNNIKKIRESEGTLTIIAVSERYLYIVEEVEGVQYLIRTLKARNRDEKLVELPEGWVTIKILDDETGCVVSCIRWDFKGYSLYYKAFDNSGGEAQLTDDCRLINIAIPLRLRPLQIPDTPFLLLDEERAVGWQDKKTKKFYILDYDNATYEPLFEVPYLTRWWEHNFGAIAWLGDVSCDNRVNHSISF